MSSQVGRHRRRLRRLRAAALGVSVVLAAGGCGLDLQSLPKIGGVSGSTYPVHAVFADVLNLPANAQVRIGAEVVGAVTSITERDFAAQLVLSIKKGVSLPVGTTAQVRFDNPLGDEYVLLHLPATGGALLAANSNLAETQTGTAPSVEDVFGALALVLNGGGIEQLQTIVHELNHTLSGTTPQGNQTQVRALLTNIDTAAGSLAGGRVAVDDALSAINGLTATLNGGSQTITRGIDAAAPAITVLAGANSQLNQLLASLQQLGQTGTAIATQSGQASVADLQALEPVVSQLNSIDQSLQGELGNVATFEADTPKIAPGGYLQVSVVANVLLPPGPSVATPGSTGYAAASTGTSGAAAVSDLLAGGLL